MSLLIELVNNILLTQNLACVNNNEKYVLQFSNYENINKGCDIIHILSKVTIYSIYILMSCIARSS